MKQTCILVLGMHRSGTSALTGVLNLLDVYLGKDLMPESENNKKGHFENNRFYVINDKLLSQSNSSWDDVFYEEKKIADLHDITELKEALVEEFKYSNLFAIKDPRIMYLFPLYEQALKELDINIKIIMPYRNPYEVASSLQKRDGYSIEKGMLLWAYHFFLAEKYSRKYERIFVGFNELLKNPKAIVKSIDDTLHLTLMSNYDEDAINDFLSTDLKHHNISLDNLSNNTPFIIRKILSIRNKFNDKSSIEQFKHLGQELFVYRELFYNEDFKQILSDLDNERQKVIELSSSLTNRETLLLEDKEVKNRLTQTIQDKEKALHVKSSELQETQAQLHESEKALHVKEEELQKKQQLLNEKNHEINSLQDELTLIYTGRSWKITRPLRKLKAYLKK